MQKIHFSNHFKASPWNKSVIALGARQVVIAWSCVCVGHSGRPRDLHTRSYTQKPLASHRTGR